MATLFRLMIVFLVATALVGCDKPVKEQNKNETPEAKVAEEESLNGSDIPYKGDELAPIRAAAQEYAASKMVGYKVNGIASTPLDGNFAFVSVDLIASKRNSKALKEMSDDELKLEMGRTLTQNHGDASPRKILNLVVQRYYKSDGSSYWFAQTITNELTATVGHKMVALRRQQADEAASREIPEHDEP